MADPHMVGGSAAAAGPGFSFKWAEIESKFDWVGMADVDVDRTIRVVDLGVLERFLPSLAYTLLTDDEATMATHTELVRMFRLTQLSLQYLLDSQERMLSRLAQAEARLACAAASPPADRKDPSVAATREDTPTSSRLSSQPPLLSVSRQPPPRPRGRIRAPGEVSSWTEDVAAALSRLQEAAEESISLANPRP